MLKELRAPFSFLKIALAIQGLLCFHTNCKIFCSSSVKNAIGNLMGIALNLEKEWQPTPVFWPGESCGQWSLLGCCPWGCTELDTTEVT